MPSGFPGSIDNFTDPLTTSPLNSPSHAGQHQDLNDAVEKVETYMGLVKVIPTGATNGTVSATGTVTIGTAVTSVTVSGAFSALYDNYRVIVYGGSFSTNAAMRVQLGSASTGYYNSWVANQYSVGTLIALSNNNSVGYWNNMGRATTTGLHLTMELFNPFAAARTAMTMHSSDLLTTGFYINQSGFLNDASSYTAFTLTFDSGNATGGTIRVYGYRN